MNEQKITIIPTHKDWGKYDYYSVEDFSNIAETLKLIESQLGEDASNLFQKWFYLGVPSSVLKDDFNNISRIYQIFDKTKILQDDYFKFKRALNDHSRLNKYTLVRPLNNEEKKNFYFYLKNYYPDFYFLRHKAAKWLKNDSIGNLTSVLKDIKTTCDLLPKFKSQLGNFLNYETISDLKKAVEKAKNVYPAKFLLSDVNKKERLRLDFDVESHMDELVRIYSFPILIYKIKQNKPKSANQVKQFFQWMNVYPTLSGLEEKINILDGCMIMSKDEKNQCALLRVSSWDACKKLQPISWCLKDSYLTFKREGKQLFMLFDLKERKIFGFSFMLKGLYLYCIHDEKNNPISGECKTQLDRYKKLGVYPKNPMLLELKYLLKQNLK